MIIQCCFVPSCCIGVLHNTNVTIRCMIAGTLQCSNRTPTSVMLPRIAVHSSTMAKFHEIWLSPDRAAVANQYKENHTGA